MSSFERKEPNFAELLAKGALTRRGLLAGSAATAAAGAWPAVLRQANAQTPKKGGTLRAGLSGAATNDTLDPTSAACCGTNLSSINYMVRNTLVETDDRYNPAAGLAES